LASSCLEPFHGELAVLRLGAPFGSLDDDAGREMADPYRRIGHVAVLPAGAGSPVELYPDVRVSDFDGH